MTTTHAMAHDLLRWHDRRRCLTKREERWVRSVSSTLHPSIAEHDMVCVLHTRAEGKVKPDERQFLRLAEEAGVSL